MRPDQQEKKNPGKNPQRTGTGGGSVNPRRQEDDPTEMPYETEEGQKKGNLKQNKDHSRLT